MVGTDAVRDGGTREVRGTSQPAISQSDARGTIRASIRRDPLTDAGERRKEDLGYAAAICARTHAESLGDTLRQSVAAARSPTRNPSGPRHVAAPRSGRGQVVRRGVPRRSHARSRGGAAQTTTPPHGGRQMSAAWMPEQLSRASEPLDPRCQEECRWQETGRRAWRLRRAQRRGVPCEHARRSRVARASAAHAERCSRGCSRAGSTR
jgi:hypothetical protein